MPALEVEGYVKQHVYLIIDLRDSKTLENTAVRLYFLDQTGYKYHVSPK